MKIQIQNIILQLSLLVSIITSLDRLPFFFIVKFEITFRIVLNLTRYLVVFGKIVFKLVLASFIIPRDKSERTKLVSEGILSLFFIQNSPDPHPTSSDEKLLLNVH